MEITYKLLRPGLFQRGFHLEKFALDSSIKEWVRRKNWPSVNEAFLKLTSPQGALFQFLREFHEFETIEFIISVREGTNEWEEDGIWHDDGSRVFAFSLSLTDEVIEGGKLGFRKKRSEDTEFIPTPAYGEIILFLTGIHGYEHNIAQVSKGCRVVIAGWCS